MTPGPSLAILVAAKQTRERNSMATTPKDLEHMIAAQSMGLAAMMLVSELYVHWLVRQKNPQKVLRILFDRINARLETREDLERGYEPRVVSEARLLIEDVSRATEKILLRYEQKKRRGPGAS
jgi:hypothetical protein